jgi:hypothetical protein
VLAKCANPSCSASLVYLREGKIFMIESPRHSQTGAAAPLPLASKIQNCVEHFWLCGPCASEMTLIYDRQHGIQVIRKKLPPPLRATAS